MEYRRFTGQTTNQYQTLLSTRDKGTLSEVIAINHLNKIGYKIIARNFYSRYGEIDIICFDRKADQYVFVEVKSLWNEKKLSIEQTVSKTKMRKIKIASRIWLQKNAGNCPSWRIDFIGIVLDNTKVVHLQSAIC